jgi:pilus assembly protein CpaD
MRPQPPLLAIGKMLIPLALCGLAACSAPEPTPASGLLPQPTAVPVSYRHSARFIGNEVGLSDAEFLRLEAFASSLPPGRPVVLQLDTGRGDGRVPGWERLALSRVETVERFLSRHVDAPLTVRTAYRQDASLAEVGIRAESYEVVLPGCPDWSRDPAFDPRNLPLSNLGCANAVNLGLMVADPADLVRTRRLDAADGVREAEAIARYRTDKVKALEAEVIQP